MLFGSYLAALIASSLGYGGIRIFLNDWWENRTPQQFLLSVISIVLILIGIYTLVAALPRY